MPIECRVDREAGVVFTRLSGAIREKELWQHLESLSGMADRPARELLDLREVEDPLDPEVLRGAAWFMEASDSRSPGSRLALLTRDRDVTYGMARLYQSYRESESVTARVFTDEDEAMAWLMAPAAADE